MPPTQIRLGTLGKQTTQPHPKQIRVGRKKESEIKNIFSYFLQAFCIVILRICEVIRNIINKASVYEEVCSCYLKICSLNTLVAEKNSTENIMCLILVQEDFQPMTYGFKLTSQVTDIRISGTYHW